MLFPLLIGGIQTANSEVIVQANTKPSLTTLLHREKWISSSITESGLDDYEFNVDFNCSISKTYDGNINNETEDKTLIWGCINALSDSVGASKSSSSNSSYTDSVATINRLGEGVAASTSLTTALKILPKT